MNRTPLIVGVAIAILLAAAGGYGLARLNPHAAEPEAKVAETKAARPADTLAMSEAAATHAGIVVQPVASGGLAAEVLAQATVTPAADGQAVLTARAAGSVTRILKRLGDPVRAGEPLAIIQSREAAQIAADRSAANAKGVLAQRNLAREKSLYEQRVSPRMDYEQAEAEAALATAEVRRAQAAAGAAGVTADGSGVVVTSPIAGHVTAVGASLGAFVQPETELFRVTDPRLVQIEAAVSGADAARIGVGDGAVLETADGRSIAGRVRAVTPILDRESRAATVILDMATAGLQPGATARVRLFPKALAQSASVAVPEEAVQTLAGREVVFVRTPSGFQAKPVTVGRRSAGRVEILSGLTAGQSIAARGAFLLKAELAKGEGEED